ncbi:MAG: hypothetical protein JWM90_1190 [Thermoleophilia bacterium]|nr:hypothetical protein [Thermoleophilia bacterium]
MKRWSDAIPISARLTIAFAGAMAVVLAVTSLWIYQRQQDGSQQAIDRRLQDRMEDLQLAAGGRAPDTARTARNLVRTDTGAIQVYDRAGAVLASSPALDDERILSNVEVRAVTGRKRWKDMAIDLAAEGEVRVLYARFGGSRNVVALLESEDASHEALEKLAVQLLLGAGVAVLLGSLLAFSLARAALRPVEHLRAEAERRGRGSDLVALPIPAARDEIGRLAVTLNELLERMHEATLRERRFVAEAGHELRTPLATIIAEIDLALESPLEPSAQAALRSLHEEATRLSILADQLLRLTTVRERSEFSEFDLAELIGRRVDRFRSAYPHSTIRWSTPGAVIANADVNGMTQAIDNLIDNAVVHGGKHIDVELTTTDNAISIRVSDDGPGIDPDIAERAFERFARSAGARTRRGSGLGLAMVLSIAQLHGGQAGIGTRADGQPGTSAWFSIARSEREATSQTRSSRA